MKTELVDARNNNVHVFDVVPGFAANAATTIHQGIQLSCYLTSVTPSIASKILLTQVNNRNVAKTRVLEYRRRMERGEWVLAEPWLFDQDGRLIDGQHRATALSQLKNHLISIPVLMVQGWPDETQSAVDIGYNRNICSIAQLQGVSIAHQHLSIMNAMLLFNSHHTMLTSPTQAIDAYHAMKEAIDFTVKLRGGSDSRFFAPVRAAAAIAYPYENHERLDRFLEVWDTMIASNAVEQSIARLRSQHESRASDSTGGSIYRRTMGLKAFAVLQAFLQNKPLRLIREKTSPWPLPSTEDGRLVLPKGW